MNKFKNSEDEILLPKFEKDCILTKGVELEKLVKTEDEEITRIRPCPSEKGKIMAEVNLRESDEPFFDPKILCELLEAYKRRFTEQKCSPKLGVGRFMWKARRVYLFERGKVHVRFALDRKDVSKTIDSAIRMVLGSVICGGCGRPAVECISESCGTCIRNEPPESVRASNYINGPLLIKAQESLKEASLEVEAMRREGTRFLSDPEAAKFNRKIDRALEFAMDFSLKTPEKQDAVLGVAVIAQALELRKYTNRC